MSQEDKSRPAKYRKDNETACDNESPPGLANVSENNGFLHLDAVPGLPVEHQQDLLC
jgi:hypothetical protein